MDNLRYLFQSLTHPFKEFLDRMKEIHKFRNRSFDVRGIRAPSFFEDYVYNTYIALIGLGVVLATLGGLTIAVALGAGILNVMPNPMGYSILGTYITLLIVLLGTLIERSS